MSAGPVDLIVVGAGPAGMAAASAATAHGLATMLVDEQPAPGGQIHRGIERRAAASAVGATDLRSGRELVAALRASAVDYRPATGVWHLGPVDEQGFEIGLVSGGIADLVSARHVLLATGAQERPMPIPGWTLPGVMTAGAAQSMLKASSIVPDGPVVLAGLGPLLYLCAAQLAEAGAEVVAILDTTPKGRYRRAIADLPAALAVPELLRQGFALLRAPARLGIGLERHVTAVEAIGDGRLQAVRWRRGGGWRELPVRHLLLHQGVVPHLNLIRLAGCEVDWHVGRHCWEPQTDAWGHSSVPGIWIAGDGAGIAGAVAAPHQGRIAAAGIAAELDRIGASDRDATVRRSRDELCRLTRFRRFVDGLYRPAPAFLVPDAATLACRCEEVSGDEVRAAVREGCHGVDAIKQYTRSGMGACQGRMCALTVAELIGEVRGISPAEAGCPTQRSPAKPLPLPTLARLSAHYEATVPERVA